MKRENAVFLVITLKHVSGVTSCVNLPRTPKLWEIADENGHKHENDEFLLRTRKRVPGVTSHVNRPGIPKLWAIAHENDHKSRKR